MAEINTKATDKFRLLKNLAFYIRENTHTHMNNSHIKINSYIGDIINIITLNDNNTDLSFYLT